MNIFKYELPNNCPDILVKEDGLESGEYSICYYRITKCSPADDSDFIPQLLLAEFSQRRKKIERENNLSLLCQMASISILKKEEDAIKLIRKFKNIGKYIYKGVIMEEHGLIIVTPSGNCPAHCSFYAYVGIDEKNIFTQKAS